MAKNSGGTRGSVNGHSYSPKVGNSELEKESNLLNTLKEDVSKFQKVVSKAEADRDASQADAVKWMKKYDDAKVKYENADIALDRKDEDLKAIAFSINSARWGGDRKKIEALEAKEKKIRHDRAVLADEVRELKKQKDDLYKKYMGKSDDYKSRSAKYNKLYVELRDKRQDYYRQIDKVERLKSGK